jgi:hypothetical protein
VSAFLNPCHLERNKVIGEADGLVESKDHRARSIKLQSEPMTNLNWSRILASGLLAGIVWIILGSVVTALLGRDFAGLPHNQLAHPTPGFILFNAAIDLLEGISAVWLYAVLRALYGPGARTAVIAGFAWWFIISLGDATWCSFGFFPPRTVIPLMLGTLPAFVLATLAGAKFYQP